MKITFKRLQSVAIIFIICTPLSMQPLSAYNRFNTMIVSGLFSIVGAASIGASAGMLHDVYDAIIHSKNPLAGHIAFGLFGLSVGAYGCIALYQAIKTIDPCLSIWS